MPTTVRSFAKINLGLAVGPLRADGFHGLATVYQTIALHDHVTVAARQATATAITLSATRGGEMARGVPQTSSGDAEKNTAWRMIAGALEKLGVAAEVEIHIDKRLPVQGGLGAGSANAAAALIALERELQVQLNKTDRLELAGQVGSDVPLFLIGGTVLGTGRGETVSALRDLAATAAVIAVPHVGVSTRAAFAALDARSLTSDDAVDKLEMLSRVLASAFRGSGQTNGPTGIPGMTSSHDASESSEKKSMHGDLAENSLLALVRTGIENDFEEVAFSQHPFLRDIKRELVGKGAGKAVIAALSGSGSALFGLYRSLDAAAAAQQRVQRAGTTALLTETLPRQAYWERTFVH